MRRAISPRLAIRIFRNIALEEKSRMPAPSPRTERPLQMHIKIGQSSQRRYEAGTACRALTTLRAGDRLFFPVRTNAEEAFAGFPPGAILGQNPHPLPPPHPFNLR